MNNRRNGNEAISRLERAGYGYLTAEPEEETGWEIVQIKTVDSCHVAYGFRANYNDLIVGGLTDLRTAEDIKECKMIGSYVAQELERQTF
jgi:hypothetical protein